MGTTTQAFTSGPEGKLADGAPMGSRRASSARPGSLRGIQFARKAPLFFWGVPEHAGLPFCLTWNRPNYMFLGLPSEAGLQMPYNALRCFLMLYDD